MNSQGKAHPRGSHSENARPQKPQHGKSLPAKAQFKADCPKESANSSSLHSGASVSPPCSEADTPPLRSEAFLIHAMEQFGGSVYLVALSQTRNEQEAQDVAQDVFVRLFTSSTQFENDEHLKAWLLRVTINRCRELYRSFWKHRVSTVDDEQVLDGLASNAISSPRNASSKDPADVVVRRLRRNPIWKLIARMPSDQRAVLVLFYVEEYSCDQIAQIMGIRSATVRTKLHRARLSLRKMLNKEGFDDDYAYE